MDLQTLARPARAAETGRAPGDRTLERLADRIRVLICRMCLRAGSGHPASSLSIADLVACLHFGGAMRWDPADPAFGDALILSKGHGAPALYASLIVAGALPEDAIARFREIDSPLQGHPDVRRLPAAQATTGALGQGLSMAIGRALGKARRGEGKVFCIIGDGETQEGQIWEAALFGGSRELPNLVAITDVNGGQGDGEVDRILPLGDLRAKWEAFGWRVAEVDGHDHGEILAALRATGRAGRPTMILARTRKGHVARGLRILGGEHGGQMTPEILATVEGALA